MDTFLDLVGHLGLVDLVILGDSLVRRRPVTPDQLVRAAQGLTEFRRHALDAADLVRAGVDSPMETRLRLLMVLAGLPEPEVNIVLRNEYGDVVRRSDMGFRSSRLALEYDGRQHAESAEQHATDIVRREELGADGWYFWTAISKDIFRHPATTLTRIVAVMQLRGMDTPPLRDDWRRHFPGR